MLLTKDHGTRGDRLIAARPGINWTAQEGPQDRKMGENTGKGITRTLIF